MRMYLRELKAGIKSLLIWTVVIALLIIVAVNKFAAFEGNYESLAILDTMQMIRNPISTVAVGVTASFGTVLLAGGTKGQRYALPHATIHLHQPLGGAEGQASDIEIMAREVLRLKSDLNQFFANVTGQPLEVIQRDTDRDFYMTADQALTYGLIDKVLQPPAKSGLSA